MIAGYPIVLLIAGPAHITGPVQATSHLQRFRIDLLEPLVPDPAPVAPIPPDSSS